MWTCTSSLYCNPWTPQSSYGITGLALMSVEKTIQTSTRSHTGKAARSNKKEKYCSAFVDLPSLVYFDFTLSSAIAKVAQNEQAFRIQ